jgi:hypothetical protein
MCPSLLDGARQADIVYALRETLRRVPRAKVVLFSRSNLFRTAIASRGTHVRKQRPSCANETVVTTFPLANFACELPHIVAFHANLYAVARDVGVKAYDVLYERLAHDAAATMRALGVWLGLDAAAVAAMAARAAAKVPRLAGPLVVTTNCSAPRRDAGVRLRDKAAFVAAVDRFAAAAGLAGTRGGACLAAMADAPNDEVFPDVIHLPPPPPPPAHTLTKVHCGPGNPTYSCGAPGPVPDYDGIHDPP